LRDYKNPQKAKMKLKVLSIDDSKTIITHLNYLFKDLEMVDWVGHAYNLSDAKNIVQQAYPDVILLDIMVNEESGFDLLSFVKTNFPGIKIFMLSNLTDQIYVKKSKQLGACHFIDKSYEFETIPGLLIEALESKKSLN
jgi:DNA-binding NarL/FixJ family response regulator